jgi:hypothetical protein
MRTIMIVVITVLLAGSIKLAKSQENTTIDDRGVSVVTFEDAQYPPIGYNSKVQGIVAVQVRLDGKGEVLGATALSGSAVLVPESLDNVKKWRFKPTASKTAVIFYNYKILDGRCNQNSSFFILQGHNIATVIACPGIVNPANSGHGGSR